MDDKLITGGKILSALAAISNPGAGLAGGVFFEALSHISAQRTNRFLQEVEGRLRALEATGILEINTLLRKESFLELLLTAATVAQRTQRREKRNRIVAAVVNCSRVMPPVEEIDSFFHLIDQLTEEHFIVLRILSDHLDECSKCSSYTGLFQVFVRHYSALSFDAFAHYLTDLKHRRLIRIGSTIHDGAGLNSTELLSIGESDPSLPRIVITDVGRQLLEFTASSSS